MSRKNVAVKSERSLKICVTGGAGFIGSAFVRLAVKCGLRIIVIDKLTYAGDLDRLDEVRGRYNFYKCDISSAKRINEILSREKVDIIVHFAAESHVDRSIVDAGPFIESNIKGTQVLLDAARRCGIKKFIHISTDEVYGDIIKGKFREEYPLKPNSPYSASKAAADLLVKSYIRTYGLPAIIVRPCNNYGPWQYPEKLIPLSILRLLRGEKVPVYAKGQNVREWLYVEDCAAAILCILQKGKMGEVYNLGSGNERKNIKVVKLILKVMGAGDNRIKFVKDRPGHDLRYALDSCKLRRCTNWQAKVKFEDGLVRTVKWFMANQKWVNKHK